MPNYFVFDTANNPLYTQLTNSYSSPGIESTPEGSASQAQLLYALTTGSTVVGSQSLLLQVTNPVGSGKTMYISSVSGGSSAAATVNLHSGGIINGGSPATPFNMNLGSTNTSIMTAIQHSGTVGGTPKLLLTLPLTSGNFHMTFTGGIIVPQGSALTVSIGTGPITASANITWWEY